MGRYGYHINTDYAYRFPDFFDFRIYYLHVGILLQSSKFYENLNTKSQWPPMAVLMKKKTPVCPRLQVGTYNSVGIEWLTYNINLSFVYVYDHRQTCWSPWQTGNDLSQAENACKSTYVISDNKSNWILLWARQQARSDPTGETREKS